MDHIVIRNSRAMIRGTRILVEKVADLMDEVDEERAERIQFQVQDLTDDQVEQALVYYEEHTGEVEEAAEERRELIDFFSTIKF